MRCLVTVAILAVCKFEQGSAFSKLQNHGNVLHNKPLLVLRGGMFGVRPKLVPQSTQNTDFNETKPTSDATTAQGTSQASMDPKLVPPVVSRGHMLRATSYSLLDEAHVTEPGLALTDITGAEAEIPNKTFTETIPFEVNRHVPLSSIAAFATLNDYCLWLTCLHCHFSLLIPSSPQDGE